MTKEELKEHCQNQIKLCEIWAKRKGENLCDNKVYEEHKLILELIEQTVILQSKIGHWIDIMVEDMPAQVCDQCKTFYPLSYTGGGHNYCPSCGSWMVEPQESEDKK